MNSIGMPFFTHSWIAAVEIVAPSVETITRSTSKKGRSKITSPFLFTTSRSLFLETDPPKPSMNTSLTNPIYQTRTPAIGDYFPRASGHNRSVIAEVGHFSTDLLEVSLQRSPQEVQELVFELRTAKDFGVEAQRGDLAHGPEDAWGCSFNDGASILEAFYPGRIVGDDALAVGEKSVLAQANPSQVEGTNVCFRGELIRQHPRLFDPVHPELSNGKLLQLTSIEAMSSLGVGNSQGFNGSPVRGARGEAMVEHLYSLVSEDSLPQGIYKAGIFRRITGRGEFELDAAPVHELGHLFW